MPLTNFPNGITSFGIPVIGAGVPALPRAVGNVYFVDQAVGNDGYSGLSPDVPLATLSRAHTLMTADQDDVAVVFGGVSNIAVRETATLTWSKNKCHIIGANAYNRISHRVSLRAASGSNFTPLMTVSADGCMFANFHMFHGYATAEAQVCMNVTGERNAFYNLHIGGGGHATAAAHVGNRSLVIAGGSGNGEHYFKDCTIGLDTVTYDAANANLEITGASPRNIFEDCRFITFAGSSGAGREFVLIGALGIDRWLEFKRCMFMNAVQSTATAMTQAMSVNASAGGTILCLDSWFHGVTDVETAASGNVYMNNAVIDTVDAGILAVGAPA